MMIQNIYGRKGKQVICDNCGDGFEADDFDDALDQMCEDGWIKKRIDGTYNHFCPDCKEGL